MQDQITFRCPDELIARIDLISDKLGVNRSEVVRNLVLMGLEDAELLNNLGVLRGYRFFKNVIVQLSENMKVEA